MDKYLLYVELIIDEEEPIRCSAPQSLPAALQSGHCTWTAPFALDGVTDNARIQLSVYFETDHGHRVDVSSLARSFHTNRLVAKERQLVTPRGHTRRNSIYGRMQKEEKEIHALRLKEVLVNYRADKSNDYIRFIVESVYVEFPCDDVNELLGRTGVKVLCNGHRSNTVCTLDNDKRYYTWQLAAADSVMTPDPHIDYDPDLDNSSANSVSNLTYIEVSRQDTVKLAFERHVFFPYTEDGLAKKQLAVKLKFLDFDALYNRNKSLGKTDGTDVAVLERGVRQDIALKLQFKPVDDVYRVTQITLVMDDYRKTIERYFTK